MKEKNECLGQNRLNMLRLGLKTRFPSSRVSTQVKKSFRFKNWPKEKIPKKNSSVTISDFRCLSGWRRSAETCRSSGTGGQTFFRRKSALLRPEPEMLSSEVPRTEGLGPLVRLVIGFWLRAILEWWGNDPLAVVVESFVCCLFVTSLIEDNL